MNESKILLVLYQFDDESSESFRDRGSHDYIQYNHFVCDSSVYKQALESKRYGKNDIKKITKIVDELLEQNKNGRFEKDGCIVYIIPSDSFPLHTCQYPLIIIKKDEIIDIDEWWYTPFKKIFSNGEWICQPYTNLRSYSMESKDEILCYLDSEYLTKCIKVNDNSEVLTAIKTNNITFNLV